MPTNLPSEYYRVEARYKAARAVHEKIALLEELIGTVPKHKGTDKLRADLRRRLSRLKTAPQSHRTASTHESSFLIDREGAGQVVIVGHANTGKSSLVRALTHAEPEVADYPFTTRIPTPGMVRAENIQVQILDTPPLNRDFIEPELFDLIRRADAMVILLDVQAFPLQQLDDTVKTLSHGRIVPQDQREPAEQDPRQVCLPTLVTVNKVDGGRWDEEFAVLQELLADQWPLVPVSVRADRYLPQFRWCLVELLDVIRVYAKPPGKEPDMEEPFVLARGSTVADLATHVHRDFVDHLRSARLWGAGAYAGQPVSRDHELHDGDVVELRS